MAFGRLPLFRGVFVVDVSDCVISIYAFSLAVGGDGGIAKVELHGPGVRPETGGVTIMMFIRTFPGGAGKPQNHAGRGVTGQDRIRATIIVTLTGDRLPENHGGVILFVVPGAKNMIDIFAFDLACVGGPGLRRHIITPRKRAVNRERLYRAYQAGSYRQGINKGRSNAIIPLLRLEGKRFLAA